MLHSVNFMKEKDKTYSDLEEKIRRLESENESLKNELKFFNSDAYEELFYQKIIDNSKDGLIIIQDTEIKYANEGLLKFSGYSLDEVIGMKFMDFIHPEDRARVVEYYLKRTRGEDVPSDYEVRAIHKSGEVKYLGINASIIDYHSKPAVISALRDVTDRVNAQLVLKQKESELSFILEVINDGYWDWDVQNNLLKFNKNFKNITGYDIGSINISNEEELIFLPPHKRKRFMNLVAEFLFEGRTYFSEEFEVSRADGTTGWVTVRGQVYKENKNGQPIRIMGTFTDITSLKFAQERQQKDLIFVTTLLNTIQTPVFYKGVDGLYQGCNKAFAEFVGYPVDKIIGSSVFDLYDKQLAEVYDKADKELFESKKQQIYEGKVKHNDGSYRDTIFYKNAYFNPNDELEGLIGVIFDVTDSKKISEELQQKNRELEKSEKELLELNDTKDKFFSIVSHDLRSPLLSLTGFTDLLSSSYDTMTKEEIEEALSSLNRNTKNVYSLVENLLDWAKIQMGKQEIFPKEVNLLSVVNTVVDVFKVSLDDKNLNVIKEINENMNLFVDSNVLHTVIRNIVSNSIKFTNAGGTITFEAKCVNDSCVLTLSDTGVGIEPEILEKLFIIDRLKTKPGLQGEKGSGLGLILSKELVESSGGSINVQSEVGKGTTFTITFPILISQS